MSDAGQREEANRYIEAVLQTVNDGYNRRMMESRMYHLEQLLLEAQKRLHAFNVDNAEQLHLTLDEFERALAEVELVLNKLRRIPRRLRRYAETMETRQ